MEWRRCTKKDIPAIRKLWESAQYGFAFPEIAGDQIVSSWCALQNGKIVCWSGAMLVPEIIAIMDPQFGSPHERMRTLGKMHVRVGQDVREAGHEKAFANLDPQFPAFERHLRKAGWWGGWKTLWISVVRVLGKKAA